MIFPRALQFNKKHIEESNRSMWLRKQYFPNSDFIKKIVVVYDYDYEI